MLNLLRDVEVAHTREAMIETTTLYTLDVIVALMILPSDMRRSWHSGQVYGLLHGHSFQTEKVLRGTPQLLALDSQVDAHAVDKGG